MIPYSEFWIEPIEKQPSISLKKIFKKNLNQEYLPADIINDFIAKHDKM
jgi:hypothetical protein